MFEPTNEMDRQAGYEQCRDGAPDQLMCTNSLFLMAGYNSQEMNFVKIYINSGK
jgi:lysosomal acid lipase/cholesteryl ester hydrolase